MKRAVIVLLSFVVATAFAAEPGAVKDVKASIKDDPNLPNVLLIGDSISMGYNEPVRKLLAGKANVHHNDGNAGPSSRGVEKIDSWLAATKGKWAVIHFNFGLHDIKMTTGGKNSQPYTTADGHQVCADDYDKNLRQMIAKMKATGAKLIWCSTTPVPEGKMDPLRKPGDEAKFNAIAKKIMDENNIPINDLYAFAAPVLAKIQKPQNVHFTDEGSMELAQRVVASIEAALKGDKP